uniref:Metallophosphoesterase domain containing 1 n=1 Tax=Pavo cristatus TaxID=9049 RepID=A0A8C9L8U8_PAVCR
MAARRHQHSRLIIEVDEYSSNPTQAFTFYNINQGLCLFSLIGFSIKQVICLFFTVLGSLPYEYKIVIAGNHELTFDQEFMADLIKQDFYYFPSVSKLKPESYENVQSLLTNCIYLQDSEVTVRGFRIYGSPWQPWFYGWGFNLPRGQALLEKWNLIPDGIDILITHGPPLGESVQRVCVLLFPIERHVCIPLLTNPGERAALQAQFLTEQACLLLLYQTGVSCHVTDCL